MESSLGKTIPSTPFLTTSFIPPASLTIGQTLCPIASKSARQSPSLREGITNKSIAVISAEAFSVYPSIRIRPRRRGSLAKAVTAESWSGPAMSATKFAMSEHSINDRSRMSIPLTGRMVATVPTTNALSGIWYFLSSSCRLSVGNTVSMQL